jgi:hypothetical protein
MAVTVRANLKVENYFAQRQAGLQELVPPQGLLTGEPLKRGDRRGLFHGKGEPSPP